MKPIAARFVSTSRVNPSSIASMPSLPHLSTADLAPHVDAINRLADAGWKLHMNHLDAQWHVALIHQSLGLPMVTVRAGGGQTSSWDGSTLNIHARSRLLGAALEQAISQADAQPIPA